MIRNENELMMKMCASKNNGLGVKVDGVFYFYENFGGEYPISRIYRHFGVDRTFTFYSMAWAHQRRVSEFMDLYKSMIENQEKEKAEKLAKVISGYVVKWSSCTLEKALKQVESMQVNYLTIA